MILTSCLMIDRRAIHPDQAVSHNIMYAIQYNHLRAIKMNDLVDLTPTLIGQYYHIRYGEIFQKDRYISSHTQNTTEVEHDTSFIFDAVPNLDDLPSEDLFFDSLIESFTKCLDPNSNIIFP